MEQAANSGSAQHTPGPWLCIPGTKDHGCGVVLTWEIVGANGRKVIELDNFHNDEIEVAANAQLIALVPELLDFVKEFLDSCESGEGGSGTNMRSARALYAKARGAAA